MSCAPPSCSAQEQVRTSLLGQLIKWNKYAAFNDLESLAVRYYLLRQRWTQIENIMPGKVKLVLWYGDGILHCWYASSTC